MVVVSIMEYQSPSRVKRVSHMGVFQNQLPEPKQGQEMRPTEECLTAVRT